LPPETDARRERRRHLLLAAALTVGVVLLALPLVLSDGKELLRVATNVHLGILAIPLALTALSYVAMSRSYQGIADAAECRLSFLEWVRITLVSNTINLIVTSAGLSGFAARLYLLAQQGIPSGRAVLISLVQTFLTNFTLLFFVLLGFVALLVSAHLPTAVLVAAGGAVVIFTAVLGWGVVLVFRRRLRRRTLYYVADAGHRLLRVVVPRWTPGRVRLWRFQHSLNQGLEFLLARKERMLWPTCWIVVDWIMMIGILWTAFLAVGYPIAIGLAVTGFAVGVCLTLVPLVPGGLGVMDFSMTGVFVSMSVPIERAAVAVLIYRVAYYVVPMLTSLFLFPGVIRQATRVVGSAGVERPGV
jgi:glycosyltransferase 2 family protein